MTKARQVAPFRNADGPSRLMMRLQRDQRGKGKKYKKGSVTGLVTLIKTLLWKQMWHYKLTLCSQEFLCMYPPRHLSARSADGSLLLFGCLEET